MDIKPLRRAKIIATLGPSSNSREVISKLILVGMDVARLNFSHGTHASHEKIIDLLHALSIEHNKHIVILQDLQGPKLRVSNMPADGLPLQADEEIILEIRQDDDGPGFLIEKNKRIFLDIPNILHCLNLGSKILLDDGKLEFEIINIAGTQIHAKVILGGILLSNKGVNLPDTDLDIPGFTEKDMQDLTFGLKKGIDAVAVSFVRNDEDINRVRDFIFNQNPEKKDIPIIAKLELPQAISNLDCIVNAADGVMVARGDLGVETSPCKVPIIQKQIIQAANQKYKLVITATQMLDSMVSNPRPTRAEASDVANAIWDGSDALMLSSETASGNYPIESLKMMDTIISTAEQKMQDWGHFQKAIIGEDQTDDIAISIAAGELANDRDVTSVAVFTQSGRTAILQSKSRPKVPILAFTPYESTYKRLGMFWGVIPFLVPFSNSLEDMIRHVEKELINELNFSINQKVVLLSGFPIGAMRSTNLALLHTIGSLENKR